MLYLIATVGECECRENEVILAIKHLLKLILFIIKVIKCQFLIKKKATGRWIEETPLTLSLEAIMFIILVCFLLFVFASSHPFTSLGDHRT